LELPGRRRAGAVLSPVSIVVTAAIAVSAVSAFAIGEEPEPQFGGEPPAGFDRSDAPAASPAGLQALTDLAARAEQARQERDAELRSPAARSARDSSRTQFGDASAAQAADLFESEFAAQLDAASVEPAELARGGSVARFLDDYTMLVNRPGTAQDTLVESSTPLRAVNEQGVDAMVDLGLEPEAQDFAPANPVVDVSLPDQLEDGAEIGGVRVFPDAGAAGTSAAQLLDGGGATLYHEAVTDTDVILAPVPTGLEASWLVRSPQAPARQRLRFALPEGAEIALAEDGGADLIDGDARLGRVLPAVAVDAQGQQVDVSYEAAGDTLVLDVDHRGEDLAYPIWVDPVI